MTARQIGYRLRALIVASFYGQFTQLLGQSAASPGGDWRGRF